MNYQPNDEIPNGEVLFRYCNPAAFPDGQLEIPISIFMDRSLSCDWKLFRQDPSTSFHIAEGKTRIIQINVCEAIRNPVNPKRSTQIIREWHQSIKYSPITSSDHDIHGENIAHSLIIGLKKAPVCEAFVANSSWFDVV
ncbi:hypothetical protein ABK01_03960 [Treponema sp. OMZ 305]|uniref:hypothetical protein n=1 Tax=Treponema sp. OMZ 305 TaxID=1659192 RepID=UPI0020A24A1B|nr:hypothetical protein [Treponema sp. OMZ 305]UTC57497.1 hypothetical protein ABK01_03960 [Treponema sp. OMZ 305]